VNAKNGHIRPGVMLTDFRRASSPDGRRRPVLTVVDMDDDSTNPDAIPNGSGQGQTSTDAPDTTSGGFPDEPPQTEEQDGTPIENPSGG
jgi:hypothetical protein